MWYLFLRQYFIKKYCFDFVAKGQYFYRIAHCSLFFYLFRPDLIIIVDELTSSGLFSDLAVSVTLADFEGFS